MFSPLFALVLGVFDLEVEGYGELGAAFHDHGADAGRPGGARDDRRLEFDATRFVAALEAEMPDVELEIEAELELEHGGTGSAREIEYDEFGEYETEVAKGGEVQLEELTIARTFAGRYRVAAGRFYVALGHLGEHYRPPDYLSAQRSEAETTIFPGQWDEMGVSFTADLGAWKLTTQVVNGLDSAGFGSRAWVSSGHQGAYEVVRASDLAAVARVDRAFGGDALVVGAAGYVGGSSRNRPKADLGPDCADPATDDVAPCGYLAGTVSIGEVHARWRHAGVRGQALAVYGHLQNADDISARNDRLSNEAGVERTPVGDNAVALAAELGFDVAPHLGLGADHALEPFVRVDHVDTMVAVRAALFDNPRFERTIAGAGLAYTFRGAVTAKLDLERRWFGSSELRAEHTARLSAGFVYP